MWVSGLRALGPCRFIGFLFVGCFGCSCVFRGVLHFFFFLNKNLSYKKKNLRLGNTFCFSIIDCLSNSLVGGPSLMTLPLTPLMRKRGHLVRETVLGV